MARNRPLPDSLPTAFAVADALAIGVGAGRLRGQDLERPFHGVRRAGRQSSASEGATSVWDAERAAYLNRVSDFVPRLRPGQFFSHSTAAAIHGAPVSVGTDIHVSVFGNGSLPRTAGVSGHRVTPGMAHIDEVNGLPVTSPASTWAMLGDLGVDDLVVVGDYLCRLWRAGFGRPAPDVPPLSDIERLETALNAGRRIGGARLRAALPLIREDSWSPRETLTRLRLGEAGLPEPELNVDLWTPHGSFLGCVDLAYPDYHVAVEYQGTLHAAQYAADIERIERLRAARWTVIEVTSALLARPTALGTRVRRALIHGGWSDPDDENAPLQSVNRADSVM